jgi:hypothetical protein
MYHTRLCPLDAFTVDDDPSIRDEDDTDVDFGRNKKRRLSDGTSRPLRSYLTRICRVANHPSSRTSFFLLHLLLLDQQSQAVSSVARAIRLLLRRQHFRRRLGVGCSERWGSREEGGRCGQDVGRVWTWRVGRVGGEEGEEGEGEG